MSTAYRILVLVIALLVNACSTVPVHTVSISSEFSTEERTAIVAAITEWQEAGAPIVLVDGKADCNIVLADTAETDKAIGTTYMWTRPGLERKTAARVEILDRSESKNWIEDLRIVTLHEIGHVITNNKAPHIAKGNVMAEWFDRKVKHLTDADLEFAGL